MRLLGAFAMVFLLGGAVVGCSSESNEESNSGGGGSGGGAPVEPDPVEPQIAPDPTGWQATGELLEARALTTVSLLQDGRVLVVGGEDDDYAMLASVELYDPVLGTFTAAAPLPEPRDHHTATVLKNGEVLITGGGSGSLISLPNGESALASAVLYDPLANTWRQTGSMNEARAGHRAALLDDGRVLVVGGGNEVGYPCAHPDCTVADSIGSAEIYDPVTGEWTATGSLAQPRIAFDLRATAVGIIASGGAANNQGLESVEIFDATTGTWRAGPKLTDQRLYHAAAVLGGKLVVAGGKIANVTPVTAVDILDEAASQWVSGSSIDEPRTGASLVSLQSGNGLIVAGNNQLGTTFLATASLYNPELDTWTSIEPLAQGRYSQATILLKDGSVLVLGGRTAAGVTRSAERSR